MFLSGGNIVCVTIAFSGSPAETLTFSPQVHTCNDNSIKEGGGRKGRMVANDYSSYPESRDIASGTLVWCAARSSVWGESVLSADEGILWLLFNLMA